MFRTTDSLLDRTTESSEKLSNPFADFLNSMYKSLGLFQHELCRSNPPETIVDPKNNRQYWNVSAEDLFAPKNLLPSKIA
jgi:hypothetical protein